MGKQIHSASDILIDHRYFSARRPPSLEDQQTLPVVGEGLSKKSLSSGKP